MEGGKRKKEGPTSAGQEWMEERRKEGREEGRSGGELKTRRHDSRTREDGAQMQKIKTP